MPHHTTPSGTLAEGPWAGNRTSLVCKAHRSQARRRDHADLAGHLRLSGLTMPGRRANHYQVRTAVGVMRIGSE
jgi:hypothetical protein